MASKKYTMGTDDWKTWAFNFFKFVLIPTALAFLTARAGFPRAPYTHILAP